MRDGQTTTSEDRATQPEALSLAIIKINLNVNPALNMGIDKTMGSRKEVYQKACGF